MSNMVLTCLDLLISTIFTDFPVATFFLLPFIRYGQSIDRAARPKRAPAVPWCSRLPLGVRSAKWKLKRKQMAGELLASLT